MSVDTASYADLLVMIAALKEENERLKDEYLQLFNKRSGRVENLQKAVWSALDRASCPGIFLQIASHAIHEHGCAEIADLKKALECAQVRVASLEKNASRYEWLRAQHWNDGKLCVVIDPKVNVKLGLSCPSLGLLDEMLDEFIRESQTQGTSL